MRDEFSFRSLKTKSDALEEKPENAFNSRKNTSNNISLNNTLNKKLPSRKDKVKSQIKEYFKNKTQLVKEDFDSFLSFIGLRVIWSTEEEQKVLWESIISKAKNKNSIDYDEALEGICEVFEYEDEDDLIDIKDIDIDSNFDDKNINNESLFHEDNNNENCIDEYWNSIKDNVKLIFGIKFVNEIFLKKFITKNNKLNINNIAMNEQDIENGLKIDLNKDNKNQIKIENEEIEKNQFEQKNFININDILTEINTKYKFIMITSEELNNYFNNLVKNNKYASRKSLTSCYIIVKNEKYQEYCLDKELIKYVNTMIEINFKEKEKLSEESKENDIMKDSNNDDDIIKNLNQFDNALLDMFNIISDNNVDQELKSILKMFNLNYIIPQKISLYNRIEEIINENKSITSAKFDDTDIQLNINKINQTNKASKVIMVPNDENNYLKQKINNLKDRNDYLLNENEELKMKLSNDNNEITLKNSNIKINKLNLPKNNTYYPKINSKNYISCRDEKHFRNKTVGDENSIFNMLNQKSNSNSQHCHTNRNPLINLNLNQINKGNNNNSNQNLLNETNNGKNTGAGNKTNSFIDYNGEEFTNSKVDLFSINGNNNIKENFLLETTELCKEPSTPTLTPRSNILDNKEDYFYLGDEHNLRIPSKISEIHSNRENYNPNNDSSNNTKKINFNKKKKMSFGINTELFNNQSDSGDNLEEKNYKYDFQYLSLNKKIVRLLLHNNEDLKSYEVFSDQINYILNGEKKQKGILLITSQCFYLIDDSKEMNCVLRISHQLLSSLSINKNSFNHLMISFNEGSFIIIEIFSRIHLLNYLKDLYYQYNYKKININFCDMFNIKLKNNMVYTYELKNKKDILLTPNFENAQKVGILMKYQENFFSAYFDEKIVVLSNIGLIVFDKNTFNKPQMIIPIIGSGVKSITAQDKRKLYCFKIKTINNEKFIFASNNSNEIKDWMKEIKRYKVKYESKMEEIVSDFNNVTK